MDNTVICCTPKRLPLARLLEAGHAAMADSIPTRERIAVSVTKCWHSDCVRLMRQQVLTPIEDSSLWGPAHADVHSIMCYQIPGAITRDGNPIPGGIDIDEQDFAFMAQVYPKTVTS